MKLPKHARHWRPEHFRAEAQKMLSDYDSYSEDVMIGAMLIASLRDGTRSLKKLARSIGGDVKRLEPFYDNLRRSKVFGSKKPRAAEWLVKDGTAVVTFTLHVCVGKGWMERAA